MEIGAAVSIYGKGRKPDQALLVGSVKANISHLEAAGGSSGLIKTVLALHHGVIPQQLHLDEPSPHVPWKRMPVQMVRDTTPWPECEERLAGITALGLVGTNAHVVLGSPPKPTAEETETTQPNRSSQLLALTARNEKALKELVSNYRDFFATNADNQTFSIDDACFTAGVGRRHYEHRLAIVVDSAADAVTRLSELSQPAARNGSSNGNGSNGSNNGASRNGSHAFHSKSASYGISKSSPKTAWVFGGEIVQNARERLVSLSQHEPVVRETISTFADRLTSHLKATNQPEFCLTSWLDSESEGDTELSPEIASFVLQACVAKLLQSWKLEPDVVMGLGVGQYLAYCASGGMCFNDALILAFEQQRNCNADAADWEAFEKLADGFNYYPPNLPMVCTVSGEVVPVHRSLGGSFWREFAEANTVHNESIASLLGQQPEVALQIGGENSPLDAAVDATKELTLLSFWKNELDASRSLITTLGELYVRGATPCFQGMFAGQSCQRLSLPTYPFQKKRYWITEISQYLNQEQTRETVESM